MNMGGSLSHRWAFQFLVACKCEDSCDTRVPEADASWSHRTCLGSEGAPPWRSIWFGPRAKWSTGWRYSPASKQLLRNSASRQDQREERWKQGSQTQPRVDCGPARTGFRRTKSKHREGRQDESIGLTVERAFARARVLVSPHVAPPVPNSSVSEAHEPLCRKMRILKGESTNARVKSRLTLSARCCPSSCLRVTPGELTVSCLHLMWNLVALLVNNNNNNRKKNLLLKQTHSTRLVMSVGVTLTSVAKPIQTST